MASQVTSDGSVIPPYNIQIPAPSIDLKGFHWTTVDNKLSDIGLHDDGGKAPPGHGVASEQLPAQQAALVADTTPSFKLAAAEGPAQPPPVQLEKQLELTETPVPAPFPLTKFSGPFAGNGFNMIFRPRSGNDKSFNGPNGEAPNPPLDFGTFEGNPLPNDNILELNLTTEQLTFGHTIGDIPNRGLAGQDDVTLQGLPYLQTVKDVTNIKTGLGDSTERPGIHFEPGMWVFVPPSTNNPNNKASVVRMASIPHGTTVNAQGLAPTAPTKGPPKFGAVDTVPRIISTAENNSPGGPIVFPSLKVANNASPRLPRNLDIFNKQQTITDEILANPNVILQNAIKGQTISETITFKVSTGPPDPKLNGGGTSNISFLRGTQVAANLNQPNPSVSNPNADVPFMSSTFWIETVQYEVKVDRFTSRGTVDLRPDMPKGSTAPTPEFRITPPAKLPSKPQTLTIPGIQIQYSQTVNLNFAGLTWPHTSVATLVPSNPQAFAMT